MNKIKYITSLPVLLALLTLSGTAQKPSSEVVPQSNPETLKAVNLPSAKEVVDKYVSAIGGREALTKHKSRKETGTIELSPMGLKGTLESYSRSDNRLLTKLNIAGIGEIVDGFDGTTAWTVNPVQGSRVKAGEELLQTKRNSMFAREANFDKIYDSLTVRGIDKVGDRDTYVVVASSKGLPDEILYFDTDNGLMLRSDSIVIAPEGKQAVNTFYEDYREVDGVKSPFKVRAKTPAFEINTAITEIKYGVDIEDSKFTQPK
ncbi:MAG TPA: hypothetical protein VFZ49_11175 [Pyrinomonadaceae bacterium]